MAFNTFWDAAFDCLDTVHFSESLQKYPLQGVGTYLLEGKASEEYGVPALEVTRNGQAANPPRSEHAMP